MGRRFTIPNTTEASKPDYAGAMLLTRGQDREGIRITSCIEGEGPRRALGLRNCLVVGTILCALAAGCFHDDDAPKNTLNVEPYVTRPRIYRAVLFSMNPREFGTIHLFNEVDKAAMERARKRYFSRANVQLVAVVRSELLPPPSTYMISSRGCNGFYEDPDSSYYYCGTTDMLSQYAFSARYNLLTLNSPSADSFAAAVFVVRPHSGEASATEVAGAFVQGTYGPKSDGCFLYADQVDTLLSAYGHFPLSYLYEDSVDYVRYSKEVYSAVFSHELGHAIGLRHARWGAGEDAKAGDDAWDNGYHRLYGGNGRCIMIESLPFYYMTDRDSLEFCRDLEGYINSGWNCVQQLEWILPAMP